MRVKWQPLDYPNHVKNPVVDFSGTNSGVLLAGDSTYRWRVLALYIRFANATNVEVYFGASATDNHLIYTYGQTVSAIYTSWFYEGDKGEAINVTSTGGAYFGCLTYVGSQEV